MKHHAILSRDFACVPNFFEQRSQHNANHPTILVTGGAGYIGSHTVRQLLDANFTVVVLDNFCNAYPESLNRVSKLCHKAPIVIRGDVRNPEILTDIFSHYAINAVIHFAGLKSVSESQRLPLQYYDDNLISTMILCEKMAEFGVTQLVFSSSATVYGSPQQLPLTEDSPKGEISNPYGRSKWMIEQMLTDLSVACPNWSITLLRYFNPIGAHPSGIIGEHPQAIPNNLLPYLTQVAVGKRTHLNVFGADYNTPDGTGVRDYIHVEDLANGHLCALAKLAQTPGLHTYNLGTGRGYSVFEIIERFQTVNGITVNYKVQSRREGDVASCYADASKAAHELAWRCRYQLDDMLLHAWRWQSQFPNGYSDIKDNLAISCVS